MMLTRRSILIGSLALTAATVARAQTPGGVMVFGGTGKLGVEIVKRLAAKGEAVTVFVRKQSKRDGLTGLKVNYAEGDLFNRDSVIEAAVAAKPRAMVVALRVMDNDVTFYVRSMINIAAAGRAAGVKQVIHHGAVGAGDNARHFTNLGWDKVPGLLDRLRDQGAGEDLLKASGLTYTIIRNARIHPETTPETGQAKLTEDQTVLTPMTRADLARLTLDCLDKPACFNKTYHVSDATLTWPPPGRN